MLRSASGLVVTLLALACTRSICNQEREVEVDAINLDAGNIGGGTPQTHSENRRLGGTDLNARDVYMVRLAGERRKGESMEHERQADQHRRHQVNQGGLYRWCHSGDLR